MGKQTKVLAIFMTVFAVTSCGCAGDTSQTRQTMTPAPNPSAVGFYDRGFDAFIFGNYSTALDLYDKSIASDPRFTRAWVAKGDVLVRLNRSAEAVSAYDSALALEGEIPEIWNSRGEALMNLGNYTGAIESFDHALRLVPEYATARENRNISVAHLT